MAGIVPGLGDRLKRFRKHRGWNQTDLANRLGISQSNMSRLESDKQDLSGFLLRKIVEMDEEWFGDLTGTSPKLPFGTVMVPVVCHVAAGVWRSVDEPQAEVPQIPVYGLEGKFRNPQAVIVDGESMNRVFRPGTILITVSPDEYLNAGYNIDSGLYVIAQKLNQSGDYETTVKQLEIRPDRSHWLWPRSNHPEHQQPIIVPPANEWPTESRAVSQLNAGETSIAAIVIMEQQLVVPTLD